MTEPKRPPELNSGPHSGGYTSGDLRKHAEDALRRLREKNVLPPAPAPASSIPETETIDGVENFGPGNTTYDLGREALRATQQSPATPMTSVPTGTQEFTDTMVLRFDVSEAAGPLIVDTIKPEMVFGRSDTATSFVPEIDLTKYGAYRLGLSRRHAVLRRQGNLLYLTDLGGRNGTALNGHRLEVNQNCLLSSGDEITLGNLRIRVTYQKR
jgi:hypothetical protein